MCESLGFYVKEFGDRHRISFVIDTCASEMAKNWLHI